MAAILVSHRCFLFACCPWCSAFPHRFVDCCVFTTLTVLTAPPCTFLKLCKSRVKIGVVVVIVDLVVLVILAVLVAAAMVSLALAKHPFAVARH
eukprot:11642285-Ditylum_brightwellii.AAC.1